MQYTYRDDRNILYTDLIKVCIQYLYTLYEKGLGFAASYISFRSCFRWISGSLTQVRHNRHRPRGMIFQRENLREGFGGLVWWIFLLDGGGLSIHPQTSQSFEKIKSLPLNNKRMPFRGLKMIVVFSAGCRGSKGAS